MTVDRVTEADIEGFLESMSNWGRWGEEDELGALNMITSEKTRAAAALVREGRSVSLARIIEFAPKVNQHEGAIPPLHFMQRSGESAREHGSDAAYDWAGLPLHGHYLTHLDALSHLFYRGHTYNGTSSGAVVSDRGALRAGVDLAHRGIVSRGVLLDIPAVRGVDWLEHTDPVMPEDLRAAEEHAGVRCAPGDAVLVRTGYGARRSTNKEVARDGLPGLAPDCLPWIHQSDLAVLGTDTGTDLSPSAFAPRLNAPVHLVCIVAMGVWIIDNLDLETVAATCAESSRYAFLFSGSPLRLKNSTGSPFNPLAVF